MQAARLCALSFLVLLGGCAQPEAPPETVSGEVFLDPQLLRSDARLYADLDHGSVGLIKLGSGWLPPEHRSRLRRWSLVSWAEQQASFFFPEPFTERVELLLDCAAAAPREREPQTMEVLLNGHSFGTQVLTEGFDELRLPLPAAHIKAGLNRVDLHFGWAAAGRDRSGVAKARTRAAVFRKIRIVARGMHEDRWLDTSSQLDRHGRRLRLVPGSPLAVPLPVGTAQLSLSDSSDRAKPGTLVLEILDGRGSRSELWRGPWRDAVAQTITIETEHGTTTELLLCLQDDGIPVTAELSLTTVHPPVAEAAPMPPHVFVYLIDTLRADALEPYGYERATSPRIKAFTKDAVVFDRAWSTSSWTLPATMSVLTGLHPHNHSHIRPGRRPVEERGELLPSMLRPRGYRSVAISQSHVVSPSFGFDRGFDSFWYSNALGRGRLESDAVRFFLWHQLRCMGSEHPLLVYLHTVDPHAPYNPTGRDHRFADEQPGSMRPWKYEPSFFQTRGPKKDAQEVAHLRALYDGEVLHADRAFGEFVDLLQYLGIYDRSLVILTSDHGEAFGDHQGFGHTRSLFEELVRVPLLVKFPGSHNGGQRVKSRASLLDLVPTIMELAGAEAPAGGDGVSLLSLMHAGEVDDGRELLASLSAGPALGRAELELTSLVSNELKCVHSGNRQDALAREIPSFRSFDLARDPHELHVLPESSLPSLECRERLEAVLARINGSGKPQSEALPEPDRESLRALGYLNPR